MKKKKSTREIRESRTRIREKESERTQEENHFCVCRFFGHVVFGNSKEFRYLDVNAGTV